MAVINLIVQQTRTNVRVVTPTVVTATDPCASILEEVTRVAASQDITREALTKYVMVRLIFVDAKR